MTLTRRTALAAPALLALPSAALARQAEPDPAVAAFEAWRAAHLELIAVLYGDCDEVEAERCLNASAAALVALSRVRATSAQGIRGQLLAALHARDSGGNAVADADPATWTAADFSRSGFAVDDAGEALLWRAIEATEAMASPHAKRVG